MPTSPTFVDFLAEQLRPMGPVDIRRMFGGHGLFLDGLMFAIVSDDRLFFKVDTGNRHRFTALERPYLEYQAKGVTIYLSYAEAPEEAYDGGEAMLEWARSAYEAALRHHGSERATLQGRRRRPIRPTALPAPKTKGKTAPKPKDKTAAKPKAKTAAKPKGKSASTPKGTSAAKTKGRSAPKTKASNRGRKDAR